MGKLVLHKKLKASSLTEVITATTILLIVFGIALVTLNNIMSSSLQKDTHKLKVKLEQLIYNYKNKNLKIPYQDSTNEGYEVTIQQIEQNSLKFIEFSITDRKRNKNVTKRVLAKNENN